MARTRTSGPSGKVLSSDPSASMSRAEKRKARATASVAPEHAELAGTWNELDAARRRQISMLMRIGRPQESVEDAELAVAYATYQRSRTWYRFFWPALVVLVIAGFVAASSVHPALVGAVLGLAGSAVIMRRNGKRTEKVNAELLGIAPLPAAA
jgi:hypothetical protein